MIQYTYRIDVIEWNSHMTSNWHIFSASLPTKWAQPFILIPYFDDKLRNMANDILCLFLNLSTEQQINLITFWKIVWTIFRSLKCEAKMHKIIVKKALEVNYNKNNKNEHKDVLCSMYDVLTQMILFIAGIQLIAVQLKITHIFHFFLTSIYSFIQKYSCESCAFFSHIYKIVTDFSRRYCCCCGIFKKMCFSSRKKTINHNPHAPLRPLKHY